jgi:DNA-binding NarL/FixJ family response regulator
VDDHDVVRQGIRLILRARPEWEIVGEAGDGFAAVEQVKSLDPDLIILDISMPRKDGFGVLNDLAQMKVRSRIVVLTMHELQELAATLRKAGASGYVVKTQAARDLIHAMEDIFEGKTFFPTGPPPAELRAHAQHSPRSKDPE